jgi:hypothetical protein
MARTIRITARLFALLLVAHSSLAIMRCTPAGAQELSSGEALAAWHNEVLYKAGAVFTQLYREQGLNWRLAAIDAACGHTPAGAIDHNSLLTRIAELSIYPLGPSAVPMRRRSGASRP